MNPTKKDDGHSPVHPCTCTCTDENRTASDSHCAQAPAGYACEWENCTETFDDSSAFLKHIESHITKRPWVCKWRGCKSVRKAFTEYRSTLLQHVIMHTSYKPHVCPVVGCGFSSPFPWCLKKHERAHVRTGTSVGKLVRRRKKLPAVGLLIGATEHVEESAAANAKASITPLVASVTDSSGAAAAAFAQSTAAKLDVAATSASGGVPAIAAVSPLAPSAAGGSTAPRVPLSSVGSSALAPAALGACKLSNPMAASVPLATCLYRPATIAIAPPTYPFSPLAALCNVATSVLGPSDIKEEHEKVKERKVLEIADLIN